MILECVVLLPRKCKSCRAGGWGRAHTQCKWQLDFNLPVVLATKAKKLEAEDDVKETAVEKMSEEDSKTNDHNVAPSIKEYITYWDS